MTGPLRPRIKVDLGVASRMFTLTVITRGRNCGTTLRHCGVNTDRTLAFALTVVIRVVVETCTGGDTVSNALGGRSGRRAEQTCSE
ncbi:hypothetical protein MRX96_013777 [Rhipicephalus microplus]